jgi:hypothetical protein
VGEQEYNPGQQESAEGFSQGFGLGGFTGVVHLGWNFGALVKWMKRQDG